MTSEIADSQIKTMWADLAVKSGPRVSLSFRNVVDYNALFVRVRTRCSAQPSRELGEERIHNVHGRDRLIAWYVQYNSTGRTDWNSQLSTSARPFTSVQSQIGNYAEKYIKVERECGTFSRPYDTTRYDTVTLDPGVTWHPWEHSTLSESINQQSLYILLY